MSVVRKNYKASSAISIVGLVIPLGLGAAIAVPIYHEFTDPSVNYGYFILFVAVAVGITVSACPACHGFFRADTRAFISVF